MKKQEKVELKDVPFYIILKMAQINRCKLFCLIVGNIVNIIERNFNIKVKNCNRKKLSKMKRAIRKCENDYYFYRLLINFSYITNFPY